LSAIYCGMDATKFLDFECVTLENAAISLLVTQSVGPRIISLRFRGGNNLFAVLPDLVVERPDGKPFHFHGGHRLWYAPEHIRTYEPDDQPVTVIPADNSISIVQHSPTQAGIDKAIRVSLVKDEPRVIVHHTLINCNLWDVELAPWAITPFRTGGVAILPQSQQQTEFLPNRSMALWQYTDPGCPQVSWGKNYILIRADMNAPFKIGYPNPRSWLAYWLDGTLFVKHADFNTHSAYCDFGSSSEVYCNDQFLELETLAPITKLAPGEAVTHVETWELFEGIDCPIDENATQKIVRKLRLN